MPNFGLLIGIFVLALLLFDILGDGLGRFLSPGFLTETPSRFPDQGGIRPAIVSSILLGLVVIFITVPIGVGAALYLEEYAPKAWWTAIVEINISNLAGVPSMVYGLLGLGVFNYLLGFGPALISGAIAMKPDVLLMDEPCSALDPISSRQVEELCLELKEQYTIIMATHNMQQASRVADFTAFFNTEIDNYGKRRGKLVEFSPTAEMFSSPQTQEAEDYISGRFG